MFKRGDPPARVHDRILLLNFEQEQTEETERECPVLCLLLVIRMN